MAQIRKHLNYFGDFCRILQVEMITALVALALVLPYTAATPYNVGDSSGWNTGVTYTNWVSGKTFVPGDTLTFTYSSQHSVLVVNKTEYDACTTTNPIQTNTVSPTTLALNSSNTVMYFICGTPGHCSQGMKLAVNVSAAGTPTTPSPPGSTTSSPPPPASSAAGSLYGRRMDVPLGFILSLLAVLLFQS